MGGDETLDRGGGGEQPEPSSGIDGTDGRVAVEAVVNSPAGLALDAAGFLYICERGENKIRRLKL